MSIPICASCLRNDAEFLVRLPGRGGWAHLCSRCAEPLAQWKEPLISAPAENACHEADVAAYVESQRFTFASTMPRIPHYYVLLRRSTNPDMHLRVVEWIRRVGEPRRWHGKVHHYWTFGHYEYWAMQPQETILNRRDVRETNRDGTRRR